ncbi:hypothetical protein PSE_3134 [Pseudovibrio sp. FO-BEG1]|nr:hypothetical protein PSE_3134 [Pseudovibrio sp. FO-BEG1]
MAYTFLKTTHFSTSPKSQIVDLISAKNDLCTCSVRSDV